MSSEYEGMIKWLTNSNYKGDNKFIVALVNAESSGAGSFGWLQVGVITDYDKKIFSLYGHQYCSGKNEIPFEDVEKYTKKQVVTSRYTNNSSFKEYCSEIELRTNTTINLYRYNSDCAETADFFEAMVDVKNFLEGNDIEKIKDDIKTCEIRKNAEGMMFIIMLAIILFIPSFILMYFKS